MLTAALAVTINPPSPGEAGLHPLSSRFLESIDSSRVDKEVIKNLQRALKQVGYYDGAIDGVWGPKTQSAYSAIARAFGQYIPPGFLDKRDIDSLEKGVPNWSLNSRTAAHRENYTRWAHTVAGGFREREQCLQAAERFFAEGGVVGPQSRGNQGATRAIQLLLLEKSSSYAGFIDGQYGPLLRSALTAFQKERGLPQTGVCDEATWRALSGSGRESKPPSPVPQQNPLGAILTQAQAKDMLTDPAFLKVFLNSHLTEDPIFKQKSLPQYLSRQQVESFVNRWNQKNPENTFKTSPFMQFDSQGRISTTVFLQALDRMGHHGTQNYSQYVLNNPQATNRSTTILNDTQFQQWFVREANEFIKCRDEKRPYGKPELGRVIEHVLNRSKLGQHDADLLLDYYKRHVDPNTTLVRTESFTPSVDATRLFRGVTKWGNPVVGAIEQHLGRINRSVQATDRELDDAFKKWGENLNYISTVLNEGLISGALARITGSPSRADNIIQSYQSFMELSSAFATSYRDLVRNAQRTGALDSELVYKAVVAYSNYLGGALQFKETLDTYNLEGFEGVKKSLLLALDCLSVGAIVGVGAGVLGGKITVQGAAAQLATAGFWRSVIPRAALASSIFSGLELQSASEAARAMERFKTEPSRALKSFGELLNEIEQTSQSNGALTNSVRNAREVIAQAERQLAERGRLSAEEVGTIIARVTAVTILFEIAGGAVRPAPPRRGTAASTHENSPPRDPPTQPGKQRTGVDVVPPRPPVDFSRVTIECEPRIQRIPNQQFDKIRKDFVRHTAEKRGERLSEAEIEVRAEQIIALYDLAGGKLLMGGESAKQLNRKITEDFLKNLEEVTIRDPGTIRTSQNSIDGASTDHLTESMRRDGFRLTIDPQNNRLTFIDVVRMPDGTLVSVDNRRVVAAEAAGVPVVVRIHDGNAKLPRSEQGRFYRDVEGPDGRITRVNASTWLEAIEFRTGGKEVPYRPEKRDNPGGS